MKQVMHTQKKQWPFSLLTLTLGAGITITMACSKKDPDASGGSNEKGYVTGIVKDTKGAPIKGAEIVIDNTMIYNSNLITNSGENGAYKVKLSGAFTWRAYATMQKTYNGKTYSFDLHPEVDEAFTSDGGVRNFSWKLRGQKPHNSAGFYGCMIQLDNAFGSTIMADDVNFTLTPDGPLVDGSAGQTLTLTGGAPQSPGYFKLLDIPLGRYKIKASYNGQNLHLKNELTNETGTELTLNFEPNINLTGLYCNNCAAIQYE
jgi:hypothetical protein